MLRRVLRDSARAPAGGCPYDDTDPHMSRQAHHPSRTACYLTADPADKRKVVGVARARCRAAASAAEPREPRGCACAEGGGGRGPRRRPRRAWAPRTPRAPTLASSQPPPFGFSATPLTPHSSPGSWEGLGLRCPSHSMSVGGTVSQTHSRRSVTQRPRPPTGRWRFGVNAQNSETHLGKTGRPREWRARTVSL